MDKVYDWVSLVGYVSTKTRVIMVATLFIAFSVAIKVLGENTFINAAVFRWANTHQYVYLNQIMLFLSRYGREYVWIPVVLVLWLPGGQYRRCSFLLFTAFITAIILGYASKYMMAEPRPFMVLENVNVLGPRPTDYSYPSGHAVIVATGALTVLSLLPKKYSVPLLIEALAVSYSRMYIGVHWPADILGGWLLGALCVLLVFHEEYRLRPLYDALSDFWDRIVYSLKYHHEEEEEEE